MSPGLTEQGARIWEVFRGIILTLRLGDIAGFSASHKKEFWLSLTYMVRFNKAESIKKTKAKLCTLIQRILTYSSENIIVILNALISYLVLLYVVRI